MPSIVGKKQGNKTYYYLVESARVGGKPRIVSQRYLGPAEEIVARLSEAGPGEPDRTRHLAFGDVAAVWAMLERLKVAEIVDEVVGARRADAAASVGTYIALATAQPGRATPAPSSPFPTGGPRPPATGWCTCPPPRSTTGAFGRPWTPSARPSWPRSSAASSPRMVEAFGVDLSGLVLDMTNFATYIDSANDRAPIAQRGHAKQKRGRPAPRRPRPGRLHRRRRSRWSPTPTRATAPTSPSSRRWSTSWSPAFRCSAGGRGRAHLGLRRRPELGGQLRAVRGLAAALRRVAPAL